MADKKVQEQLYAIEKLREIHRTKPAVYAGAVSLAGWSAGKQITEAEYLSAVSKFLNYPSKKEVFPNA